MSITDNKITRWNNPIVNEADRPQRSASDMKAIFDSNSNQLRDALNNLIDALASGGAEDIGAAVEGMEGQNVETILAELKALIDAAENAHDELNTSYEQFVEDLASASGATKVGAAVDGMEGRDVAAILAELKGAADTAEEAHNALDADFDRFADTLTSSSGADTIGASVEGITGNTVAAVLTALKVLSDRIVTNSDGKLFLANDGTYRLPDAGEASNGLPVGGNVGDILYKNSDAAYEGEWRSPEAAGLMAASIYDPDDDGVVSAADNANKLGGKAASEYSSLTLLRSAVLTVDAWSGDGPYTQNVTVSGVLADATKQAINVSPAPGYGAAYGAAGVECTAQRANGLTFTCAAVPQSAITVNISIQEAKA